ncbi:alpha/beta fold hydrolase [Paenibacillus sp. P25]|nr:alpha/beta fold hydrolase [Paenibacillus sp. P25]
MKLNRKVIQKTIGFILTLLLLLTWMLPAAKAASPDYKEENVKFQSGDAALEGTLLLPSTQGPYPAVVLVHGSNSSDREKYRGEAEMFAKAGIAALIFDKRADGFSKSRAGGRSYAVLADDVSAAVRALATRANIDRTSIGLWGISEGGWVASLAAAKPQSNVSFLITVGAVGVKPVQQQSWRLVNRLYDQGVTSNSMIRSVALHGLQLAVSAGLFAEALYDPVPVFEKVKQPVLAIWGSSDRVEPPLESSRIIQAALERSGNDRYTLQFFPNAGHLLRTTPDGIKQSDAFAPGYAEAMTSWVHQAVRGQAPVKSVVGSPPRQDHLSPAGVDRLAWYNTASVQLGSALVLMIGFAGYMVKLAVRRLRKKGVGVEQASVPAHRSKLVLSAAGFFSIVGFILYFGYLMTSGAKHLAPVIGDRTWVWILLQWMALAAGVATILVIRSWWITRSASAGTDKVKGYLLPVGGILFIGWALYWQLLLP